MEHLVGTSWSLTRESKIPITWRYDVLISTRTFYQTKDSWPMKDSADPLDGWPALEVVQNTKPAKHDTYGNLFYHIQDILLKFCHRIKKLSICFNLFEVDASELPSMLRQCEMGQHSFDRIEVSTKLISLDKTRTFFTP